MTDHVASRTEDGIFVLTLARPETKNALSVAMYSAMTAALRAADADDRVAVIVLRGQGGNFTSGNDLKDFLENPPAGPESAVFQFMHAVAALEKPVLAEVEGVAVGIGTTLLLHCDLVYAAERARFMLPFVNLALVPEAGSSYLLPRVLGHRRAAELLFFGEPFDAQTAHELGLVNRILPAEQLAEFTMDRARALAAKPPTALRTTKALLKSHWQAPMLAHLDEEATLFTSLLGTPEVKEALSAFFEKRKPDFRKG